MQKRKLNKTHILIAVYVVLLVIELFFYVPYERIEIFRSNQNVPHAEIIGSGYTTIEEISSDTAYLDKNNKIATGKRVNTPQLMINVVFTTLLFIAIYFVSFYKNKTKSKSTNTQLSLFDIANTVPPVLDVNGLAFATEEEIKQAQRDYAQEMYKYVIEVVL